MFACETAAAGGVMSLLQDLLSAEYDLDVIETAPADVGFGYCTRNRAYLVGVNKHFGALRPNIVDTYRLLCKDTSSAQIDPMNFWWLDRSDHLLAELHQLHSELRPKPTTANDFSHTLQSFELLDVAAYEDLRQQQRGLGAMCLQVLLV
jgi:hypothetical protein